MIDPAAAERDHLVRVEPEREDVLALGHLHDVADGRRPRDLLAHELRQRRVGDVWHRAMILRGDYAEIIRRLAAEESSADYADYADYGCEEYTVDAKVTKSTAEDCRSRAAAEGRGTVTDGGVQERLTLCGRLDAAIRPYAPVVDRRARDRRNLRHLRNLRINQQPWRAVDSSKARAEVGMPAVDAMRQDVKGAVRSLWKSPGFAVAALITLALGIGATSAIFSVVKAVLLTRLPYANPEQRVLIWSKWISFDKTWLADAGSGRLPPAEQDDDGDRRVGDRSAEPDRRWRPGARSASGSSRRTRSTCSAPRRSLGRIVLRRGGPAERSAGGDPRLSALAGALRRRSVDRRPEDHAERRARRSHRRHAERLPAADRLHRGRGRADAICGGRCRSTSRT